MTDRTESADAPPFLTLPSAPVPLKKYFRAMVSDPASVIPDSVYDDWVVGSRVPRAPLVITRPETVRKILLDKGETFGRNNQLRTLMRRAWGKGLAAAEDEDWAKHRRAASTLFRPENVSATRTAFVRVAREAAEQWPDDKPLDIGSETGPIIAGMLASSVLTDLNPEDGRQIAADIPEFVADISKFGLLDALPLPGRLLDWWRGVGKSDAEQRLRSIAADMAEKRAHGPDAVQDMPALMRGSGPLQDNILGFMPAGFETSARAVAWGLYLLARYPDWQERLRKEALACADNQQRPLARQVAQEALRLYPPAPLIVRSAVRPTEVEGHKLATGQVAMIAVFAMHRHRKLWDAPDAFRPERFEKGSDAKMSAFLPFCAGPRLCISAQLEIGRAACWERE